MVIQSGRQQKSFQDIVEYLNQSIMRSKMASSHFIEEQAKMIHAYAENAYQSILVLKNRDIKDFYKEINRLLVHLLEKETIIFKKIETIITMQPTKTMTKLDGQHLNTVLLNYYIAISHLFESFLKLNDKYMKWLIKLNKNNQKSYYLIIEIIDHLFEHHQLAQKHISLLYYHGHLTYDQHINKVLINNIEANIILIKKILTDASLKDKNIIMLLHKKIILFMRLKKEITLSIKENPENQNLSSPWLSNTIKRKKK